MAKSRFPGKALKLNLRKRIRFRDNDEFNNEEIKALQIRKGLTLFKNLFGNSDEEDEFEFEGFCPQTGESKITCKKSLTRVRTSDLPSSSKKEGTIRISSSSLLVSNNTIEAVEDSPTPEIKLPSKVRQLTLIEKLNREKKAMMLNRLNASRRNLSKVQLKKLQLKSNSFFSKRAQIVTRKSMLKKKKMHKKFILPTVSVRSSRIIIPNKRLFSDITAMCSTPGQSTVNESELHESENKRQLRPRKEALPQINGEDSMEEKDEVCRSISLYTDSITEQFRGQVGRPPKRLTRRSDLDPVDSFSLNDLSPSKESKEDKVKEKIEKLLRSPWDDRLNPAKKEKEEENVQEMPQSKSILRKARLNLNKKTLQKIRSPSSVQRLIPDQEEDSTEAKCVICRSSESTVRRYGASCCPACNTTITNAIDGTFGNVECIGGQGECQIVRLSLDERCLACCLSRILLVCTVPSLLHDRLRKQLPAVLRDKVPSSLLRSNNMLSHLTELDSSDQSKRQNSGESGRIFGSVVDLPGGWKRKNGTEVTVISPSGEKFKSISKLEEYLKCQGVAANPSVLFGNTNFSSFQAPEIKPSLNVSSKHNNVVVTTLPGGWSRRIKWRNVGNRWDTYVCSPDGRTFRSRKELKAYFLQIGKVDDIHKYFPLTNIDSCTNSTDPSETSNEPSSSSEICSEHSADEKIVDVQSEPEMIKEKRHVTRKRESRLLSNSSPQPKIPGTIDISDFNTQSSESGKDLDISPKSLIPHNEPCVLEDNTGHINLLTLTNSNEVTEDVSNDKGNFIRISFKDCLAKKFINQDDSLLQENSKKSHKKHKKKKKKKHKRHSIDDTEQRLHPNREYANLSPHPPEQNLRRSERRKQIACDNNDKEDEVIRNQISECFETKMVDDPKVPLATLNEGVASSTIDELVLKPVDVLETAEEIKDNELNNSSLSKKDKNLGGKLEDILDKNNKGMNFKVPIIRKKKRLPKNIASRKEKVAKQNRKKSSFTKEAFGNNWTRKIKWNENGEGRVAFLTSPDGQRFVSSIELLAYFKKAGKPVHNMEYYFPSKLVRSVKDVDPSAVPNSSQMSTIELPTESDPDNIDGKSESSQKIKIKSSVPAKLSRREILLKKRKLNKMKIIKGHTEKSMPAIPNGGPRVKHVCRSQAQVLGMTRAVFPSPEKPISESKDLDEKETSEVSLNKVAKKTLWCGKCFGCTTQNCQKCSNCLNMKRFGGPGTKKKPCILRKCINLKLSKTGLIKTFIPKKQKVAKSSLEMLAPEIVNCGPRLLQDGDSNPLEEDDMDDIDSIGDSVSYYKGHKNDLSFYECNNFWDEESEILDVERSVFVPRQMYKAVDGKDQRSDIQIGKELTPGGRINIDYWQGYDAEEMLLCGFPIITSSLVDQAGFCFRCGSKGKEQLYFCAFCCEGVHPFCMEEGEGPESELEETFWVCRRCIVCHVCGGSGHDSLMQCSSCRMHYHLECLGPSSHSACHSSTHQTWLCVACSKCSSCGNSNVVQWLDVPSKIRKQQDVLESPSTNVDTMLEDIAIQKPFCSRCIQLRENKNFCPLCTGCYEDDDFDSKMMECGRCMEWIHARCEGISDEYYQVLSLLPDSVEYICRLCLNGDSACWLDAIKREMFSGMDAVLEAVMATKSSRHIMPKRQILPNRTPTPQFPSKIPSEQQPKVTNWKAQSVNDSSPNDIFVNTKQKHEGDGKAIPLVESFSSNHSVCDEGLLTSGPNGTSEKKDELCSNNTSSNSCRPLTRSFVGHTSKSSCEESTKMKDCSVKLLDIYKPIKTNEELIDSEQKEISDSYEHQNECTKYHPNFQDSQEKLYSHKEIPSYDIIPSMKISKDIDDDCISSEESSFCGSDTDIESLVDESEDPKDFYEVKARLKDGKYQQSLLHFHIDVLRLLENGKTINRTQSRSCRSTYLKQLKEHFPWFDVKSINIFSLVDKNRPFPAPSDDHNYFVLKAPERSSSALSLNNSLLTPTKGLTKPPKILEEASDSRKCVLCSTSGDDDPNNSGRLLYLGQDEWIHVNCAIWSSEVYEEEDGGLQNVYVAVSRGKQIKCSLCQDRGATIGCCHKSCQVAYHFLCAKQMNCQFEADKRIFCSLHSLSMENYKKTVDFRVSRCVYVDMDSEKKRWKKVLTNKVKIVIGSLIIESLGKILPNLDCPEALIPIDFVCSRFYWSTVDPTKMAKYTCQTKWIYPSEEEAIPSDFVFNKTINHADSAEVVQNEMAIVKKWMKSLENRQLERQTRETNIIPPHLCPLYKNLLKEEMKRKKKSVNNITDGSQMPAEIKSCVEDLIEKVAQATEEENLVLDAVLPTIVTPDDNKIISMVLKELQLGDSSIFQSTPSTSGRQSPFDLDFLAACDHDVAQILSQDASNNMFQGDATESTYEETSTSDANSLMYQKFFEACDVQMQKQIVDLNSPVSEASIYASQHHYPVASNSEVKLNHMSGSNSYVSSTPMSNDRYLNMTSTAHSTHFSSEVKEKYSLGSHSISSSEHVDMNYQMRDFCNPPNQNCSDMLHQQSCVQEVNNIFCPETSSLNQPIDSFHRNAQTESTVESSQSFNSMVNNSLIIPDPPKGFSSNQSREELKSSLPIPSTSCEIVSNKDHINNHTACTSNQDDPFQRLTHCFDRNSSSLSDLSPTIGYNAIKETLSQNICKKDSSNFTLLPVEVPFNTASTSSKKQVCRVLPMLSSNSSRRSSSASDQSDFTNTSHPEHTSTTQDTQRLVHDTNPNSQEEKQSSNESENSKSKGKICMKRNYRTVIKKYPLRSCFRKNKAYETVQIEIKETIEMPDDTDKVCKSVKRKWRGVLDSDDDYDLSPAKGTQNTEENTIYSNEHNGSSRSHKVVKFSDDRNDITVSIVNNDRLCKLPTHKKRSRYRHKTLLQLDGAVDNSSSEMSDDVENANSSNKKYPLLQSDLALRIKQQSLARSIPDDEGPYECSKCKNSYRTKDSFNSHYQSCNYEIYSSLSSSTSEDEEKSMISTSSKDEHAKSKSENHPTVNEVPLINKKLDNSRINVLSKDKDAHDLKLSSKAGIPPTQIPNTSIDKLKEVVSSSTFPEQLFKDALNNTSNVAKKENSSDISRKTPGLHRQIRNAVRPKPDEAEVKLSQNVSNGADVFIPPAASPLKLSSSVKKTTSPRRYTNVRLLKGNQGYQYRRAQSQIIANSQQSQSQLSSSAQIQRGVQPHVLPVSIQPVIDASTFGVQTPPLPSQSPQYHYSLQQPISHISSAFPASTQLTTVGQFTAQVETPQVLSVLSGPSLAVPQGYALQYVGNYRNGDACAPTRVLSYPSNSVVMPSSLVVAPHPQPSPVVVPQVVGANIAYTLATPETLVLNQPTVIPSVQYIPQQSQLSVTNQNTFEPRPQQAILQQPFIQTAGEIQQLGSVVHYGQKITATTPSQSSSVQLTLPTETITPKIECSLPEVPCTLTFDTSPSPCVNNLNLNINNVSGQIPVPVPHFNHDTYKVKPKASIAPQIQQNPSKIPQETNPIKIELSPTTSRPLLSKTTMARSVATVAPAIFTSTVATTASNSNESIFSLIKPDSPLFSTLKPRPTYSYRDAMRDSLPERKHQQPAEGLKTEKKEIQQCQTHEKMPEPLPPPFLKPESIPKEKIPETNSNYKLSSSKGKESDLHTFKLLFRKDNAASTKLNLLPIKGPSINLPSPEVKELRIKAKVSVGPKRKKFYNSEANRDLIIAQKDTTNDLMVNEQLPNLSIDTGNNPNSSEDPNLFQKPKSSPEPYIIFELTSDDGFKVESKYMSDVWQQVFDAVSEARESLKFGSELPSMEGGIKRGNISGLDMLGLTHNAVQYLLEQLPGSKDCHRYSFQFHRRPKEDDKIKENSSGCARTEAFKTRSPYDVFSWLASKHRRLPQKMTIISEEIQLSTRRATSLELPMAMRYRHLCETAREAVGVFRSNIHGRGLFCKRDIDLGEMVIEYAGQVIRSSLCDIREKYYESRGIGCYMFRIDDETVIDATMHGNAARFINHSCDPNCYSRVVDILGKKHIIIFALRRILRGEELTYDYKFPIEDDKIPCTCHTRRCRKYLN